MHVSTLEMEIRIESFVLPATGVKLLDGTLMISTWRGPVEEERGDALRFSQPDDDDLHLPSPDPDPFSPYSSSSGDS